MAVIKVTEDFKGWGATDEIEANGTLTGAAPRVFDVDFDTGDVGANRVFLAKADSRIPQIGEAHPFSPWIFVTNRTVAVNALSPLAFKVTVNYTEIENPLEQPTIIEWLSASVTEPIDTDIDDNPIVNSSDEPFDPPPTEEFDDLLLRGVYNVAVFNPVDASIYKGAINTDFFLGFDPGQAKVVTYISREIKAITGNFYVEVTVEIQFRSDGWKRKFVDQGYRVKTGVDIDGKPTYEEIKDDEGDPITEPVFLDGNGEKLDDGDPVVRLEFDTKPQLPFIPEFGAFF